MIRRKQNKGISVIISIIIVFLIMLSNWKGLFDIYDLSDIYNEKHHYHHLSHSTTASTTASTSTSTSTSTSKTNPKIKVGPNSNKKAFDEMQAEISLTQTHMKQRNESKQEPINHNIEFRQHTQIRLNSKNVNERMNKQTDIAFFFLIPKSGTSTLRTIMTNCLNLRMAVSIGLIDASDYAFSKPLHVIDKKPHAGRFVNVAFGDLSGIEKAKYLRMAESGLVDVAITSHLHPGVNAFTPDHPARIMTLFRHPVKRIISHYYYIQMAEWEKTYHKEVKGMTMMEYVKDGRFYEDNWVTRMLSNVHGTELNEDDFIYAQNLLKEKIFILLLDELEESVDRMLHYMNWISNENEAQIQKGLMEKKCIDSILSKPTNKSNHDKDDVTEGSEVWTAIASINHYDMELYKLAKELFNGPQKQMMVDMLPTT